MLYAFKYRHFFTIVLLLTQLSEPRIYVDGRNIRDLRIFLEFVTVMRTVIQYLSYNINKNTYKGYGK